MSVADDDDKARFNTSISKLNLERGFRGSHISQAGQHATIVPWKKQSTSPDEALVLKRAAVPMLHLVKENAFIASTKLVTSSPLGERLRSPKHRASRNLASSQIIKDDDDDEKVEEEDEEQEEEEGGKEDPEVVAIPRAFASGARSLVEEHFKVAVFKVAVPPESTAAEMEDGALASMSTLLGGCPGDPVDDMVDEEDNEDEDDTVVYSRYRPSHVEAQNFGFKITMHPGRLVETETLASAMSRKPLYDITPSLAPAAKAGFISDIQLESVICASEAHSHLIRGPSCYRAGFTLADGAGVDARRDLVALGADFIKIVDLAQLPYGKIDRKNGINEGIVFSTYASFISASKKGTRFQQLTSWFGRGSGKDGKPAHFDGVIILDEAHKAKSAAKEGKKASKTGKLILDLQSSCPNARLVYSTATPASSPEELAYMSRLGLWGDALGWKTFSDFASAMEKRGLGAMELFASSMKQKGQFISRSLSFDQCSFSIESAPLSDIYRELHAGASAVWGDLRRLLIKAISVTGLKPGSFMSTYFGSFQRFFKALCISAKITVLVAEVKGAIAAGQCVVIGLQTTGESVTARTVKAGNVLCGFVSEMEVILKDAIQHVPTALSKKASRDNEYDFDDGSEFEDEDEEGEDCSENGMKNDQPEDANAAEQKRVDLLEIEAAKVELSRRADNLKLPPAFLDNLIDVLGGPTVVAELTGRKHRVVRIKKAGEIDSYLVQPRGEGATKEENLREKASFMNGHKLIAIISDAASTGISLHADHGAKNQRRRVHITPELAWSADKAIQQFGRTHRSNQSSGPIFKIIISDVAGEIRFAYAVAARISSLGAISKGDHRAGSGQDLSHFDISEGRYSALALRDMYTIVESGRLDHAFFMADIDARRFLAEARAGFVDAGLADMEKETFRFSERSTNKAPKPDVKRFLNRLLAFPLSVQQKLFDLWMLLLKNLVRQAKTANTYKDLHADVPGICAIKASEKLATLADGTILTNLSLEVDRGMTWAAALTRQRDETAVLAKEAKTRGMAVEMELRFYVRREPSISQGKVQPALALVPKKLGGANVLIKIWKPNVPMQRRPLREFTTWYKSVTATELYSCQKLWTQWYDHCGASCAHFMGCKFVNCSFGRRTELRTVLTGPVMDMWAELENVCNDDLKVVRMSAAQPDGTISRIVGLEVASASLASLRNYLVRKPHGSILPALVDRCEAAPVDKELFETFAANVKMLQKAAAAASAEANGAAEPTAKTKAAPATGAKLPAAAKALTSSYFDSDDDDFE